MTLSSKVNAMNSIVDVIVERPDAVRCHKKLLRHLMSSTVGEVRVASAYVTENELLLRCDGRKRRRRLLTSLLPMDMASGATSLECLRSLIDDSVEVRCYRHSRLHAKIYLFGEQDAVVTSANLTRSAMESNLEVGVRITGDHVHRLNTWYEERWSESEEVNMEMLADLSNSAVELRRKWKKLKAAAEKRLTVPSSKSIPVQSALVKALRDPGRSVWLVNTNRRYDHKTERGGYRLEGRMLDQGLAVVWESFNYPSHMSAVSAGDVILAYAKKVGIKAVGFAEAGAKVIRGKSGDRILPFEEYSFPEWQIPTDWIRRVDDEDALPMPDAPNASFINVSGEKYAEIRNSLVGHFADTGV